MGTKRTSRSQRANANVAPDQMKLTARQAERLSSMTGVSVADLKGATIADLTEKLKWRIDPNLLLFRRICGQVVKTDPVTGVDYPVPFATVHVEDTDCSFLGFFPVEGPWGWLFPLICHREDIATVVTDECGRFCVWIPWFDIDWILRWRRERICYFDFFVRPSIWDILKHFQLVPEEVLPPIGPTPDPPPFVFQAGGLSFQRLESLLGRDVALELGAAESGLRFGNKASAFRDVLNRPAFASPPPPPIPPDMRALNAREGIKGLTTRMAVSAEVFAQRKFELDFDRFIGPFLRCRDIFVPEWTPILDVPDITFRVTQDVDGDGDQETVYSEGFFDVRWNSGSIPDVTLHASAIALTSPICHTPSVDCNGSPSIQFAGLMPVDANYINPATGYGVRPNRPHPHGLLAEAPTPGNSATAPFRATVQLYGCNRYEGAQFYRMMYSFNGAASVPFTNRAWYIYPWGGGPAHHVVPDAQGWYPILNNPGDWHPANLLLDWPTSQYPNGLYSVSMQLGNASKAVVQTTASVPFRVDNATPNGQFTSLAWRVQGSTTWTYFPSLVCPVVSRPVIGGVPQSIEFRVSYVASATHLLKTILSGSGCGGGLPDRLAAPNWSDPPTAAFDGSGLSQNPYDHWHIDAGDNTVIRSAIFSLPGARPEGAYGFNLSTYSRAFNPDGGDAADPLAADWYFDAASLIWRHTFLPVAVVNA
jgi:hypothetical protein